MPTTSDNLQLSRPSLAANSPLVHGRERTLSDYLHAAISPNTRRAYRADLDHYFAWGGTIPSTPEELAHYLADHADRFAVATLVRRLSAISIAHKALGEVSPTGDLLVTTALRGIRRLHGRRQKQARPILVSELFAMLDGLGQSLQDMRDRALLLVGFAGAFRRSELVEIDCEDLEWCAQGLIVHIGRTKTDIGGKGRKIGIPLAKGRHCPVHATQHWLSQAGITEGPVFRPLRNLGEVRRTRLSSEAVSLIVKARIKAAGFDPALYSGHSLRAGLATSAAMVGVPSWKIRQQTGHTSDVMLGRYIRDAELFRSNAAGQLL